LFAIHNETARQASLGLAGLGLARALRFIT
jgi:hypothetical protein